MAKGDYLKNYKGPRGRINKSDLNGLAISNMVEFVMPETGETAYGKVIEFKRRPEGVLAEISVKALQQPDGSWVRYHDYFDFKHVLIADLVAAPPGVLQKRTKVMQRKVGE
jgi:hypothetical protein